MRQNETGICEQDVPWGVLLGRTPLRGKGRWGGQGERLTCAVHAVAIEISGGSATDMALQKGLA